MARIAPAKLEEVVRLYLAGVPKAEITRKTGIARNKVDSSLRDYWEREYSRIRERLDAVRGAHLARTEYLIQQAARAWRKSTRESVAVREELVAGDGTPENPGVVSRTVTRTTKCGDAKFLVAILQLQQEQRRLLGDDETRSGDDPPAEFYLPATGRERSETQSQGEGD